jgi:hypothetical protein
MPVRAAIVDAVTNAGRVIALIDIFGRKRSRIRGETAHPRGMD